MSPGRNRRRDGVLPKDDRLIELVISTPDRWACDHVLGLMSPPNAVEYAVVFIGPERIDDLREWEAQAAKECNRVAD